MLPSLSVSSEGWSNEDGEKLHCGMMGYLRILMFLSLLLVADTQRWPLNGDCQPCQCYYKTTSFGRVRHVNCSQRGFHSLPEGLPEDMMALDLSWNPLDIGSLRQQLCEYPSLQSVSLSFTELTDLSDIFKQCYSVLEVNLTGNRLTQLDSHTFQGLENLRRLLGLEVESILRQDVFQSLIKLKDLDLIYHGSSLPEGIFDNMMFQSLNLVLTEAKILPKGIFAFGIKTLHIIQLVGEQVEELNNDLLDGLYVLRKLFLVMPQVKSLPTDFFHSQQRNSNLTQAANLQQVEITGIGSIPSNLFDQLDNLESLLLKDISEFPDQGFLGNVVNLRMLVITGSQITTIKAGWFKELYSLKSLRLTTLQLEKIEDDAFQGLINLNHLDLSYNSLEQINSKTLQPLRQTLESLLLTGNFLSELNENCLKGIVSLRYLDLSENRLSNIYSASFRGMNLLSVLYLANNRLTSLPEDIFADQLQLESVSLNDNYLVEFPAALLTLKNSLINLDLSFNEIRQIPAEDLCYFGYLEKITLLQNPLHCDCKLLAIQSCPKIAVDGVCKTPADYAGQQIQKAEILKSCPTLTTQSTKIPKNISPNPVTFTGNTEKLVAMEKTKQILNSTQISADEPEVLKKLFADNSNLQTQIELPKLQMDQNDIGELPVGKNDHQSSKSQKNPKELDYPLKDNKQMSIFGSKITDNMQKENINKEKGYVENIFKNKTDILNGAFKDQDSLLKFSDMKTKSLNSPEKIKDSITQQDAMNQLNGFGKGNRNESHSVTNLLTTTTSIKSVNFARNKMLESEDNLVTLSPLKSKSEKTLSHQSDVLKANREKQNVIGENTIQGIGSVNHNFNKDDNSKMQDSSIDLGMIEGKNKIPTQEGIEENKSNTPASVEKQEKNTKLSNSKQILNQKQLVGYQNEQNSFDASLKQNNLYSKESAIKQGKIKASTSVIGSEEQSDDPAGNVRPQIMSNPSLIENNQDSLEIPNKTDQVKIELTSRSPSVQSDLSKQGLNIIKDYIQSRNVKNTSLKQEILKQNAGPTEISDKFPELNIGPTTALIKINLQSQSNLLNSTFVELSHPFKKPGSVDKNMTKKVSLDPNKIPWTTTLLPVSSADKAHTAKKAGGSIKDTLQPLGKEMVVNDMDDKEDKKNYEMTAFNFTIGALAAILVFVGLVMTIYGIRRCQRQGTYIVSGADNELQNIEGTLQQVPLDKLSSEYARNSDQKSDQLTVGY